MTTTETAAIHLHVDIRGSWMLDLGSKKLAGRNAHDLSGVAHAMAEAGKAGETTAGERHADGSGG